MAQSNLDLVPQTQKCKCCGKELPLEAFSVSSFGRLKTCKDCVRKRQSEGHARQREKEKKMAEYRDARTLRLHDFNPRELMAELKRRGYKFKMEYTETHIIDSKDIEI